ncbi:Uncharacterised protein [Legionella lansingensis]|uniref:Uncharacterized protein n=1 Tax=Legionella lansingensis TaxID=45067 RepID=A0A0W0VQF4_9GAMM|nr:hypothetical protein [Legionella lansingensis]KTD22293.1 hypothetical protein Llan_1234 [Legionella lansingensis]SNV50669.1 Uncharacterised protein [Legionella lansingensis]
MTQDKQEMNKKIENLIFLQNLIPGKQDSLFIESFKQNVLDKDDDEEQKQYRQQLLNQSPPKLTFRSKKEEDEFYKKEAINCSNFCCGSQVLQTNLYTHQINLVPDDNYMLSIGTGKLYEGTASKIRGELQDDIRSEPFGSTKQGQVLTGLKEFNTTLDQEVQGSPSLETKEASAKEKSRSPFQTEPKPWKEE